MKKLILFSFAFFFIGAAFGQSQRMVFIEHFTQASCGPCAAVNPGYQALLDNNADKVVQLRTQTSWPGYDPMYDHNPTEASARTSYYGVNAVPNTVMDGAGPGSTNTVVSQATIDNRYAVESPFDIDLTHEISNTFDRIDVTMVITATTDFTQAIDAKIAIIEEEIVFTSSPGSNGETVFENVMKKMLPNQNGTSLPSSWVAGDTYTVEVSWEFENVYDMTKIGAIAYIQGANQAVHQSAQSHANLVPSGADDALPVGSAASGILGIDDVCGNTASPVIEIMNGGSSTLTSANISYSINGEAPAFYSWTGSLEFLERATVTLPSIAFTPYTFNTLEVTTGLPSGNQDVNTDNDTYSTNFVPSISTTLNGVIEIRTGAGPDLITWNLKDDNGQTVYSGGPYTDAFTDYPTNITLDDLACYDLTVNNGYPNGFNGFARLFDDASEQLINIPLIGNDTKYASFGTYPQVLDASTLINDEQVNIFPNPVTQTLNVQFDLLETAKVSLEVYNALGQVVTVEANTFAAGETQTSIDVDTYSNGIYFLIVKTEGGSLTKRFVVNK